MPKSTADIECVCSWLEVHFWHGEYMHGVRSWHIVYTHNPSPLRADPNFLTHFTAKGGPSIFERSGLLFVAKMIQEIISMPRADSGYSHNFMVKSLVFKDDESESEAKTNSGPRACLFLFEGPHFACVEHAQCPLLAYCVSTHTPICH